MVKEIGDEKGHRELNKNCTEKRTQIWKLLNTNEIQCFLYLRFSHDLTHIEIIQMRQNDRYIEWDIHNEWYN